MARTISKLLLDRSTQFGLEIIFITGPGFEIGLASWLGVSTVCEVNFSTEHQAQHFVRSISPDVIVSPLFGMQPLEAFTSVVGVEHIVHMPDTLALEKPDYFSQQDLAWRLPVYEALRSASCVITRSQSSRMRLRELAGVSEDKLKISYAHVSTPFDYESSQIDIKKLVPFLFYPANAWKHKRHRLLRPIMNRIWKRRPELKLVLTGEHPHDFLEANSLRIPGDIARQMVIDLGFVSESSIKDLYSNAEALIFVSEYEGFGIPLLEAMEYGCPVVASNTTSIPEVVDDAAILVNGEDPDEWCHAITVTLPSHRERLLECGKKRAAHFTEEDAFQPWLQCFEEIAVSARAKPRRASDPQASFSSEDWNEAVDTFDDLFAESHNYNLINDFNAFASIVTKLKLFDDVFYKSQLDIEIDDPLQYFYLHGDEVEADPHPLFSVQYYRQCSGKMLGSKSALLDWLQSGSGNEISCHPLLNLKHYRQQVPELTNNASIIGHFQQIGWWLGLSPHPLFDTCFYMENGFQSCSAKDPLSDYLADGWLAGRNPHPLFDSTFYLSRNQDVKEAGLNPLVHFVTSGHAECRQPNPLFDTGYYLRENPDVRQANRNALVHYVKFGATEGRRPHFLFDPVFYISQFSKDELQPPNPLIHYLRLGWRRGLRPHQLFDPKYYAAQLTEELDCEPLSHFVTKGHSCGKNPHPLFDTNYYKNQVGKTSFKGTSLEHYLRDGFRQHLSPHPLFDVSQYLSENADALKENIDPLSHFLSKGHLTKPNPHLLFDADYFLSQQKESFQEPAIVTFIKNDTLAADPHPLFSANYYARHVQIPFTKASDALKHYLLHGWKEGKNPHPLFDTSYYQWQVGAFAEPVSYFLKHGGNPHPLLRTDFIEGKLLGKSPNIVLDYLKAPGPFLDPHPLFSSSFYAKQANIDETTAAGAVVHYLSGGWEAGLNPHPLFDVGFYLNLEPNLAKEIEPLSHYVEFGYLEGRNPHPLFDAAYYCSQESLLRNFEGSPLEHYVLYGSQTKLDPHPLFSTHVFEQSIIDGKLVLRNEPPLLNYLKEPFEADPNGKFDTLFYLACNPELLKEGTNPLLHYLRNGKIRPTSPFFESDTSDLRNFAESCGANAIVLVGTGFSDVTTKSLSTSFRDTTFIKVVLTKEKYRRGKTKLSALQFRAICNGVLTRIISFDIGEQLPYVMELCSLLQPKRMFVDAFIDEQSIYARFSKAVDLPYVLYASDNGDEFIERPLNSLAYGAPIYVQNEKLLDQLEAREQGHRIVVSSFADLLRSRSKDSLDSLNLIDLKEDPKEYEKCILLEQAKAKNDPEAEKLLNWIYLLPDRDKDFARYLQSRDFSVALKILRYFGIHKSTSVCEIGGGPGFLSWALKKSGFQNVDLLEPSTEWNTGTGYLSSLEITKGIGLYEDLSRWHRAEKLYDVLITRNCIHHFDNITRAAAIVRQKLKANGRWFALREAFADNAAELAALLTTHPFCQPYHLYEWFYPASHYVEAIQLAGFRLIGVIPTGYENNCLATYSEINPSNEDKLTATIDAWLQTEPSRTVSEFWSEVEQSGSRSNSKKSYTRPQMMIFEKIFCP